MDLEGSGGGLIVRYFPRIHPEGLRKTKLLFDVTLIRRDHTDLQFKTTGFFDKTIVSGFMKPISRNWFPPFMARIRMLNTE
jgi:hypothetical protein